MFGVGCFIILLCIWILDYKTDKVDEKKLYDYKASKKLKDSHINSQVNNDRGETMGDRLTMFK